MTTDERPKTRNRLLLYIGISILTTIAGSLTLPMFGDGTMSWAEFRFSWTRLALETIVAGAITARAFIDRTPSEESAEANTGRPITRPAEPYRGPVIP